MNIRFSDRLSYKQARNTVILAFLLGMTLSIAQISIDYLNEKQSIDSQVKAIIDITHNPASRIAYNIDSELAQELVTGLLESPIIISAEIVDNTRTTLAFAQREKTDSSYREISDLLFGRSREYREHLQVLHDPEEELGYLHLEVDTFAIGSAFLRRAGFTLFSGFVRTLVLSIILLVLFYFMLTKPLVKLIESISRRNPERDGPSPIPCPTGHEADEIGVLVAATNEHVSSIRANLKRRLAAEEQLQEHLSKLETVVEQRTADLSRANRQLVSSNAQLDKARSEAESMAHARSVFLANMSHEIRTPINGVLGMISLALEGDLPDKQRLQLETAYSSATILTQLLNDILDLTKFDSGNMVLEEIDFDLRACLEQSTRLLSENAAQKSLYLSIDIDPALPERLVGDPVRVHQLASNLLSNAIKFTEQGEVQVCAGFTYAAADRIRVTLEVNDTGIGIDHSVLSDILKPFTQADTATTRKYGGTGLGLSLCQRLTDAMEGTLEIDSTPGQGSTFRVVLPLKLSQPVVAPPAFPDDIAVEPILCLCHHGLMDSLEKHLSHWNIPHLSLGGEGATRSTVMGKQRYPLAIVESDESAALIRAQEPGIRIVRAALQRDLVAESELKPLGYDAQLTLPLQRNELFQLLADLMGYRISEAPIESVGIERNTQSLEVLLVEDNETNQRVAEAMLEHLGHRVTLCGNGKRALELSRVRAFDLILMDCNMPIMDGYETTRRMRQINGVRNLPIIALTANALSEDRQKCLDAGMSDYISKPFRKEELARTIDKWARQPSETATASSPA
ncbi:response regulator [Aestuariirhabdus litorea]|uniref:histidine kinase n=1 Tax=Aestuariirhabdus litorea TaxID=2528527 RepID=A0A3P3VP48_9GAMM|nr:response regulator [Aestuariirhabdus litorea]RRJ84475.1 response regulator [Aestuariirhabdus litorea]RWW97699.1 response regulator [Endozoicomonadaceae bacterium GTF-13]